MNKRVLFKILGSLLAAAALAYVVAVYVVDKPPAFPSEGWCCLASQVFPSTDAECVEMGGHFFATQEEADDYCQSEGPAEGWCFLHGEVSPSTEAECLETGGHFFATQEGADDYCRGEAPAGGWCCLHGEVSPSTEAECLEMGGHFFATQEGANDYCRGEGPAEGWCCLHGEVFPYAEPECAALGGQFFPTAEGAEEYCRGEVRGISDLKGPDWRRYVGTVVTVEGIFVRDPLPMLVTDLGLVRVNMPMPDDGYIILTGNQAEEINPDVYGGAKLKLTGQVEAMNDPVNYMGEYVAVHSTRHELVERLEVYYPRLVEFVIDPRARQPNSYAILFSGGCGPASNHIRYWNDLKFMYSTLINEYGYLPEHIAVLYANGSPPKDSKGVPDTQMPVHYAATEANLETVFNLLRQTTTTEDLIFMFTTNHGGGFKKDDLSSPIGLSYTGRFDADGDEGAEALDEKKYNRDLNGDGKIQDQVSWDEELCGWGGSIFDDAFDNMFANLEYERMVIVMEQCFSGGLIADMAGPNRIIISAASEYEPSNAMGSYPWDTFDEFSYYFTCAINGADDQGKTVDADTNNDGQVSMVEAFNYAESKDTQAEIPYYEDNGDGVPHSGPVPKGGDGTLGSNTFL